MSRQEGFQVHRRPVPLQKGCRDGGMQENQCHKARESPGHLSFSFLGLTSFEDGNIARRSFDFGDTSDTTYIDIFHIYIYIHSYIISLQDILHQSIFCICLSS